MDSKISSRVCGQRAAPDDEMWTRPDGSRWLHYDCIAEHSFHRMCLLSPRAEGGRATTTADKIAPATALRCRHRCCCARISD